MPVVLIILLIAVLAGFFIRRQSPANQLEKARQLSREKRWAEAETLFRKLWATAPGAPAGLAELMLSRAAANAFPEQDYQQILELRGTMPPNADIPAYNKLAARAGLGIAQAKFETYKTGPDKMDGLKSVLAFIQKAIKDGSEADFEQLAVAIRKDITGHYYTLGKEFERGRKHVVALEQYKQALAAGPDKSMAANLSLRREICRAKAGEQMAAVPGEVEKNCDMQIQADYHYRRALQQLDARDFESAGISVAKVPGPEADKLRSFLQNELNKAIVARVNAMNTQITHLHEQRLDAIGMEGMYKNIDGLQVLVRNVFPKIAAQLDELRPAIFNRLLNAYMSAGRHAEAGTLITAFPRFWEKPELLKSLAQSSLGVVCAEGLSQKNYKDILSAWLTAAHSDMVVLASLETTTWDDEYTFTLADSIGSNYMAHMALPANVNYDEPGEGNVSIGDTQRELISEFEQLLHTQVSDKVLLDDVLSFYDSETQALRRVVAQLALDMLFPTPHFAQAHGLAADIIAALEKNFEGGRGEESLEIALLYGSLGGSGSAAKYATVKVQASLFTAAIGRADYSALSGLAGTEGMKAMPSFKAFAESFESECIQSLKEAAYDDDDNEELIEGIGAAIQLFPKSDHLKHIYAAHVANVVVSAVNADRMDNYAALLLILRGYRMQPENARVATNLVKLADMNLMDVLNDRTSREQEIFAELDKLMPARSNAFMYAASELADRREELIVPYRQDGKDVNWLNTQYTPANITAAGLKLKKVLTKFLELSGGSLR